MKDLKERITVIIKTTHTEGTFQAHVTGFLPGDEMVDFELELEGCYTEQILKDTLNSSIEEILDIRYNYVEGLVDDTLLYDGGNFNEPN